MAWLGWKRGFAISKVLEKLKADSFGISEKELSEAIKRERESEEKGIVASHCGPFQIPSARKYFFQKYIQDADVPSNFVACSTSVGVCDFYHPLPPQEILKIAQWLLEKYRMNRRGAGLEIEDYAEGAKTRELRRKQLDEDALMAIVEVGLDAPFFFYNFYRGNRKIIKLAIPLRMKSIKRMSRYVMPFPSLTYYYYSTGSPHLGDD